MSDATSQATQLTVAEMRLGELAAAVEALIAATGGDHNVA